MKDLKQRTVRGGLAKMCSQAAGFILRIGSLAVLARLLDPRDFGLVGMVTVFAGFFALFKDAGLSTVTIQRPIIRDTEISALFWINLIVGTVLGLLLLVTSPLLAAFYHEPKLVSVAGVVAAGFVFNGAGVQHSAILTRQMRFGVLAAVEVIALVASTVVGIGMAVSGWGYWALVAMTVAAPVVSTLGYWFMSGWIPRAPRREVGVGAMIRFGGTVTLNGLIVYVAYNADKLLLGRIWGAEALGVYGRAYQLINVPTENLNSAVSGVAVAVLSRLQDDPVRLRSYFLRAYSLVVAVTVPVTVCCAIYASDIILVLLGPKWTSVASVFRLLAPTVVGFALINPLGWIMFSTGKVRRSLNIAFVLAPVVILGYVCGLPYGPDGVALGFSVAIAFLVVPVSVWAVHGSVISGRDLLRSVGPPLISATAATLVGLVTGIWIDDIVSPFVRLVLEAGSLLLVYAFVLLYVCRQKSSYVDLFHAVASFRSPPETVREAPTDSSI